MRVGRMLLVQSIQGAGLTLFLFSVDNDPTHSRYLAGVASSRINSQRLSNIILSLGIDNPLEFKHPT